MCQSSACQPSCQLDCQPFCQPVYQPTDMGSNYENTCNFEPIFFEPLKDTRDPQLLEFCKGLIQAEDRHLNKPGPNIKHLNQVIKGMVSIEY